MIESHNQEKGLILGEKAKDLFIRGSLIEALDKNTEAMKTFRLDERRGRPSMFVWTPSYEKNFMILVDNHFFILWFLCLNSNKSMKKSWENNIKLFIRQCLNIFKKQEISNFSCFFRVQSWKTLIEQTKNIYPLLRFLKNNELEFSWNHTFKTKRLPRHKDVPDVVKLNDKSYDYYWALATIRARKWNNGIIEVPDYKNIAGFYVHMELVGIMNSSFDIRVSPDPLNTTKREVNFVLSNL